MTGHVQRRGRGLAGLLIGLVFILPLYWVLVIATGRHGDAYAIPPVLIPGLQFAAIGYVLTHTNIVHYFLNSVLITSLTIVLVLTTGVLAGWGLAAYHYRGREALFLVAIGVMMLPQQALIVTQFSVMFHLGLLDSYAGLILPFGASSAAIFLFRQAFLQLPESFWDVARLEGANVFQYLWRVAVPTARPAVATVTLLTFIVSWSQFQWPLIMTSSKAVQPLELALSHYMASFSSNWRDLTSAAVIALVPVVGVFVFTQQYMVRAVVGEDRGVTE
ncbi:MAG: carbohydrate ABC transporter permease [Candidatus Dormibacteria bacterium]